MDHKFLVNQKLMANKFFHDLSEHLRSLNRHLNNSIKMYVLLYWLYIYEC